MCWLTKYLGVMPTIVNADDSQGCNHNLFNYLSSVAILILKNVFVSLGGVKAKCTLQVVLMSPLKDMCIAFLNRLIWKLNIFQVFLQLK